MKRLSLILVLMLVISLLPMGTVSAQANASAISVAPQFLEVVGIENPVASKNDTDTVTRAEALSVFVRLFGYNADSSALVPFTDTDDTISGELKFSIDLGMISASDTFRPNDAITYNEAIKMCVVALGYDYLAKAYGGWPVGYVKMASDVNLSDGLPLSENTISKTGFYMMLENLLTAEMLELDGMVEEEITYRRYTTVLETYFDMYEVEGIVTANEYTGLYSLDGAMSEGSISISEYNFTCSDNANLIGYNVKGYVNSSNDKVALVTPVSNNTKTVSFADMVSCSGNVFTYYDGTKDAKIRLDSLTAFIYNGKSKADCKPASYAGQNGHFTFIDNDSDGVYEVCKVYHTSTVVVAGVNTEDGYISDKNGARRIDLSDDDCTYFIYENGIEKNLTDIKKEQLLSCYVSEDELYVEIVVETDSVSGVITGFNNTANTIVIDDTEYSYSNYFQKYYLSKMKSGSEISALLSSSGLIEAASDSVADGVDFGYYIDVAKGTGIDSSLIAKLVAKDGKIITADIDKRLKFDGVTYNDIADITNLFFDGAGNKKLASQLVRYKLTSDGKLTLLDTCSSTEGYITSNDDYENNLTKYCYPANTDDLLHDTIWNSSTSNIVHPWYKVNENTFFIQVGSNESVDEDKRYVVRDLSWFKAKKNFARANSGTYNVDENGIAGAMVFTEPPSVSISDDSTRGIIQSVSTAYDANLNECIKLVVFRNEKYNDVYMMQSNFPYPDRTDYASDSAYTTAVEACPFDENGNPRYAVGDYIGYETDSQGYLTALKVEYDASARKILYKNTNQMYYCYYYGGVYSLGNGTMTVLRAASDGVNLDVGHQRYVFDIPSSIMIYDSATGEITTTTSDSLETYLQVGDSCTRVLVTTNDLNLQSCIIYR